MKDVIKVLEHCSDYSSPCITYVSNPRKTIVEFGHTVFTTYWDSNNPGDIELITSYRLCQSLRLESIKTLRRFNASSLEGRMISAFLKVYQNREQDELSNELAKARFE